MERYPEKLIILMNMKHSLKTHKVDMRRRIKKMKKKIKATNNKDEISAINKNIKRMIRTYKGHVKRVYKEIDQFVDFGMLEEIQSHHYFKMCRAINSVLNDKKIGSHETGNIKASAEEYFKSNGRTNGKVRFIRTLKYLWYLEKKILLKADKLSPGKMESSLMHRDYLKKLISKTTCVCYSDVPQSMVELKREQIKLHREIKQTRRLLNGTD